LFFNCLLAMHCFAQRNIQAELVASGKIVAIDTLHVDGFPVLPSYFEGARMNMDSIRALEKENDRQRIIRGSIRVEEVKAENVDRIKRGEAILIAAAEEKSLYVYVQWNVLAYRVRLKSVGLGKGYDHLEEGDTITILSDRFPDLTPKLAKGKGYRIDFYKDGIVSKSFNTPELMAYFKTRRMYWISYLQLSE
jgi:hypothetical protein